MTDTFEFQGNVCSKEGIYIYTANFKKVIIFKYKDIT